MSGALRRGSLYILLAALLTGSLWRGGYFPTPAAASGLPGSLLTPRWSLTALLLLAGVWELAALAAERRAAFLRSPLLWLFTAFSAYAGMTWFWSSFPAVTVRDFVLLLALLSAFVVARGQGLRFPGDASRTIAWWLVYTAAFVSAWGIVTYVLRMSPYANEVDGIFRAGGTLEYSNALGCFALMAMPFAAALMRGAARDDLSLLGVALTLQVGAVFLSLSRLALMLLALMSIYLLVEGRGGVRFVLALSSLGCGLGLAAVSMLAAEAGLGWAGMALPAALVALGYFAQGYLIGAGREKALRIAYAAGAAVLAAAAAGIALAPRARNIIYERFGEGFALSRLLPHRKDTWAGAVDAFRERPLKGWGLGSFPQVYQEFSFTAYTKYAHNLVLQAAVDGGVIGAALVASFLFWVVILSLWRLARKAYPLARAAAPAALVFICFNLFDWEWYVPALAAWFMAVAAVLEGAGGEERQGQAASRSTVRNTI